METQMNTLRVNYAGSSHTQDRQLSSFKDNFYDLHLYKPVAEADHQLMELANTFVDIPISAHIAFCCDSVRMTLFFTRQQG